MLNFKFNVNMDVWLQQIRNAERTCFIDEGKKKIHYKFENGQEMAEEYSTETNVLLKRAWKVNRRFSGKGEWVIEIGDLEAMPDNNAEVGIRETNTSPFLSVRMTKNCIEWRIRNLPYNLDTYSVDANAEDRCIIIRTTNNKFFKKIKVPDLERLQLPIEQNRITISHKFNTLIISYKKPVELMNCERLTLEEINKMQTQNETANQCPTS